MALRYNERTGMFEEVPEDPRIHSFTFDGNPIRYQDEIVTFRWNVQDAVRVLLNGEELSPNSSSHNLQLSSSGLQDFVLRVENGGIHQTQTVQLKVLETPNFNVEQSRDKLRRGKNEQCIIKWNISNAESVRLRYDNKEETVDNVSELTVSPDETKEYTLDAVGIDGNRHFEYIIKIEVFDEAIVEFEVDKNITLPHVPIKLSWNVQNAGEVELVGFGNVDFTGEKIFDIDREHVYTLKVTDAFGINEYKQSIKMYPLPLIRSIMVPTPKINQTLNVETHFEQKNIQVDIHVNTGKIPDITGIKTDVFVPLIPFHELELTPRKDWWDKITDMNKSLTNRISEKLSSLWNR